MMSDVDDTTMKECDNSCRREIPAVPTPDWSIENIKASVPNKISLEKTNNSVGDPESLEMKNSSNLNSISCASASSGVKVIDMQKTFTGRTALEDLGSMKPSISRVNGDITSTPTHIITTPIYNPHSTMAVATPAAASGVNQAINSIKLQNCVSTVNVGCELKLLDIYCKTRYSEYNPQRFQGVVMKLMDPRATALIFKSGKIVCTGARNEYDSYIAARKFARIIERLGFPTKFMDFKIQNFCATADLKFPIRLEALQQAHGQFASYEPELFPGLVYRMVRPRVVLLIFVNGKIVFTGGKNRNEITEALEIIYPILRGYRIS